MGPHSKDRAPVLPPAWVKVTERDKHSSLLQTYKSFIVEGEENFFVNSSDVGHQVFDRRISTKKW
jgi:hypothetical protein